jgi:hypothetical protein
MPPLAIKGEACNVTKRLRPKSFKTTQALKQYNI